MAMIVRRVRIVLRSFGWWSWRLNSLSNLNSLSGRSGHWLRPWSPAKSVSVDWGSQRHGQTARGDRALGPAGSLFPVPARAERPAGVPARPAGSGGSRLYLVVYLDSLLIGELPDQVAEAT
jgi:hypothetical protein